MTVKRGRKKGSISEYLSLEDSGIILIEEIAAVVLSSDNETGEENTVIILKNSGVRITSRKPHHILIRKVKSYLSRKARQPEPEVD